MIPAAAISTPVLVAVIAGAVLLVVATLMALWSRTQGSGFGWMVIAGFAYCILGLAAAMQSRESDGLRAAVVQLVAVILAAILGSLLSTDNEGEGSRPDSFSSAARGFAWISLLGLPPSVGFHAKVMVYHSLLGAGWGALTVLAIAAAVVGIGPALGALRAAPPLPLRGSRATVALLLVVLILMLGLYPQFTLSLADVVEKATG